MLERRKGKNYLWRLVIGEDKIDFGYTENFSEREYNSFSGYFKTDHSYSKDNPIVKSIVNETLKLSKILNLDLNLNRKNLLVERGFKKLVFVYGNTIFYAGLINGEISVWDPNCGAFTRKQYNGIFDYIEALKKLNLFF